MKRIPALEVDGQYLADSAAICAYLEKVYPEPALYPTDPLELGRVIWFQRYVDYDLAMRLYLRRVPQPGGSCA